MADHGNLPAQGTPGLERPQRATDIIAERDKPRKIIRKNRDSQAVHETYCVSNGD